MTCAETRDLFSALADDALDPSERAALDAHLAGCADCRRELAGLLRTVKLVRALDPGYAPAGFVDRVLAAARPTPWPTWLARRLALPVGVAALLVIGGLAAMLFRASPEQQRAAQYPATTPTPTAPASSPTASTPSPTAQEPSPAAPATSATPLAPSRETKSVEPAPSADKRADTRTPAREATPRAESPQTMADRQVATPPRVAENRDAKRESSDRAQLKDSAKTKDSAQPKEAPQTQDSVERLAKAGDATPSVAQRTSEAQDGRAAAASKPATPQMSPLSRTGPMTGIPSAPPDVTARLRIADVSTGERSLVALAARLGGRQTGRRIDGGRLVVELAIPRDNYADFVREATALGSLSIERQATERPMVAVAVTVVR
jgi:Putative zinc-finger